MRPKRSQELENLSSSLLSPSSEWETKAASSANSRSLIMTVLVFDLARNLAMSKR